MNGHLILLISLSKNWAAEQATHFFQPVYPFTTVVHAKSKIMNRLMETNGTTRNFQSELENDYTNEVTAIMIRNAYLKQC